MRDNGEAVLPSRAEVVGSAGMLVQLELWTVSEVYPSSDPCFCDADLGINLSTALTRRTMTVQSSGA